MTTDRLAEPHLQDADPSLVEPRFAIRQVHLGRRASEDLRQGTCSPNLCAAHGVEPWYYKARIGGSMVRDLLIAALIVVIAVVLGIVVHPLLLHGT